MSYQRPQYYNSGSRSHSRSQSRRWRSEQIHQGWNENKPSVNELQREIQRLGSLLEMERAKWFHENQKVVNLEKELRAAKSELEKQKNPKEVFVNKGKEIKRTLLAVEKFTNSETLSPAAAASNVHSEIKRKRKNLLQQEFEELQASHNASKKTFLSQIQAEKENSDALKQELEKLKTKYEELQSKYEVKIHEIDQMKVSYHQLQVSYEGDVSALREQAEAILSQNSMRDLKIINDLGTEKDNLQNQLSAFQQMFSARELNHQTELENLRKELREREEPGPPRRKVARRQVRHGENNTTPKNIIPDPASMDLDFLLEETLSEDCEVPHASPEEVNDFVEEMLRDSHILYQNPMEVKNLRLKTRVRKHRKSRS